MRLSRMTTDMKIPINYAEASETLKKYLKLSGFSRSIQVCDKERRHSCGNAGARQDNTALRHDWSCPERRADLLFSTAGRHECNGGAWALGLREITDSLKNGDFYFKLGKFESSAACKRTIDRVPHLQTLETYATLYAPLEKTPFDPQVVLIVASPWSDAETRPERAVPDGWEDQRGIRRDPVGMFRCMCPDLPERAGELLAGM